MTRISSWLMVSIAAVLVVLAGGRAISAEDKYTLKVPNGLAFSEFKGYEGWQTISISHNGELLAVILGNPAMIDARKAGGFACHTIVKKQDYVFTEYPKR
jgi:hypothetical protein